MEEVAFPRGGTRPHVSTEKEHVRERNLFGDHQSKKKRKREEQEIENFSTGEKGDLHLKSVDLLTYNKLQPSMILLGVVKEVLAVTLKVQLPGTLYADVHLNAISDKLTQSLLNNDGDGQVMTTLNDLFKVGEFIPIQILDIGETEQGSKRVIGTINPKSINSQHSSKVFKKDMLIWGSVLEKSDHVYSIDVGVNNTRCILNINDVDDGKEYVQGQPLWLLIQNVASSNNVTTLKVTNKTTNLTNYTTPECNLDAILPGSCIQLSVTKILKDGIEVSFFSGCNGYISKIYLDTPDVKLNTYEDQKLKAFVLYRNPLTKFIYFSLRGIESCEEPTFENGHIISSKIVDNFVKGVLIRLANKEFGFVTNKRLLRSLKAKDSADVTELVKRKYTKGSTMKCRVMDYSYVDKMYICTFETDQIKEKFFSKHDLVPGQLVDGVIESINKSGVVVRVGKLQCFAVNEQLTNVAYSEMVKQQYKVGQKIKARIWMVTDSSVRLTLKPALVNSDVCLTSYETAEINKQYFGVVVFIRSNMVLVKFYGDVKGIILNTTYDQKFPLLFFQGQVVRVTVNSKQKNKLHLSFEEFQRESKGEILTVGKIVEGSVINIREDGVNVQGPLFAGFVPTNHLCVDTRLSKVMLDSIKVGDQVGNLLCIAKKAKQGAILSGREYSFFKDVAMPKSNTLPIGGVVRASVVSYEEDILKLEVYTLESVVYVTVEKKDITDNKDILDSLNFAVGQPLLVNLTEQVRDNIYTGTTKMSKVFKNNMEYASRYLLNYLQEAERIKLLAKDEGDALGMYAVGQIVQCKVISSSSVGCCVELEDGTKGLVVAANMPKNLPLNSSHKGIVLYVNLVDRVLEISLQTSVINQHFDDVSTANIPLNEELFGKFLLIREKFAICSVKRQGKKYFCYVPIQLTENDFVPNYEFFATREKLRIVTSAVSGSIFVCFAKDNIRTIERNEKKRKMEVADKKAAKKSKKVKVVVEAQQENNGDKVEMTVKTLSNGKEKIKKEISKAVPVSAKTKKNEPPKPSAVLQLPSMKSFFDEPDIKDEEVSDSNPDEIEAEPRKKKPKTLTKEQLAEQLRKDEEDLRKKELEYANMKESDIPKTVEQFDRRVLAEPNNSMLWGQFAAFYIGTAEIDKARSILKRAIETIDPKEQQERLNVWIVYLNLENSFGTKQTFDEVFQEAVRCNDDLTIYIKALDILSKSSKISDVDQLITKMTSKFKQELKVYIEVAKVYFKQGRFPEARKLRSKALSTIVNKHQHVPLIVQFAKLEFEHGEYEYAETLFETLLTESPQRVDVWCAYVDQLAKYDKIDMARRVLQRAVNQRLKIARMGKLCKKFVAFEDKYGDEESKEASQNILKQVLSRFGSKKEPME